MEFPVEQATFTSRPASGVGIFHAAAAPFRAFGRFVVDLGERTPVMRALDQLHTTSDDALRARGLTRDAEIRRVLWAHYPL
jgi:hypothetical protein